VIQLFLQCEKLNRLALRTLWFIIVVMVVVLGQEHKSNQQACMRDSVGHFLVFQVKTQGRFTHNYRESLKQGEE
jgi:hypothetical protein